jgi:hypothetical protein
MERYAAWGAALFLLILLLLAAAGAAVVEILAAPVTAAGAALSEQIPIQQLDAAQFCVLGKIRPGVASGYGTYTVQQLTNATTIYNTGQSLNLPPYAAVVAIATAMQESGLYNLDHGDRDSLGLFQQRPSQGWGTPAQIMDPIYASTKFYEALMEVPGWQTMLLYQAAQAVQHSGLPTAYQQWSTPAQYLVASISGALDTCEAH